MSDLTKILAENQEEKLKLIAPVAKTSAEHHIVEDSDPETENVFPATTSTPRKI